MDKKTLRAIPRPEALDAVLDKAKAIPKNDHGYAGWILEVRRIDDQVIVINCFNSNLVCNDYREASYRIFVTDEDYITQDLTRKTAKWLTGRMEYVISRVSNNTWSLQHQDSDQIVLADPESEKTFREVIPETEPQYFYGHGLLADITAYQMQIIKRRLRIKEEKELESTREAMSHVSDDIPRYFKDWVRENTLKPYGYMLYIPSKSNRVKGFCSMCQKHVMLSRKADHPMRGTNGICPSCGARVKFKSINSGWGKSEDITNLEKAAFAQKLDNGFVIRTLHFLLTTRLDKEKEELIQDIGYREDERSIFSLDKDTNKWMRDTYSYGYYKSNLDEEQWFPGNMASLWNINLCTTGLAECLKGTPWEYSGLIEYQDHDQTQKIYLSSYLNFSIEKPYFEYLSKLGMTNIINYLLESYYTDIDETSKTPEGLLKLKKTYFRQLKRINGGRYELSILKQMQADNVQAKDDEVMLWRKLFTSYASDEVLGVIDSHHISMMKFMRYILKQAVNTYKAFPESILEKSIEEIISGPNMSEKTYGIAIDWRDYIRMASELKYNLHDEYYLLPPDIIKAHARVVEEHKAHEDMLIKMQMEKQRMMIKKISDELKDQNPFKSKSKKFMIVVPESPSDLVYEGTHNHNCVGTYVGKVAKGETLILFIRRVEDPGTPYYTMEYQNGELIQCRGDHNVSAKGDVQAFSLCVTQMLKRWEASRNQKGGNNAPEHHRAVG